MSSAVRQRSPTWRQWPCPRSVFSSRVAVLLALLMSGDCVESQQVIGDNLQQSVVSLVVSDCVNSQ